MANRRGWTAFGTGSARGMVWRRWVVHGVASWSMKVITVHVEYVAASTKYLQDVYALDFAGGRWPKGCVALLVACINGSGHCTSLRPCQQRYQRHCQLIMYRATSSARVVDNVEEVARGWSRTWTRFKMWQWYEKICDSVCRQTIVFTINK